MRTISTLYFAAVLLAAPAAPASAANAAEYPWCARYADDHGGTNCGFVSLVQCEAALSGNGGVCDRNPFYAPSPAPLARSRKPSSVRR